MADKKISELPILTNADANDADIVPIVDVSSGITSKITLAELLLRFQGNDGPAGPAGATGATGPQGASGIGVINGGTANQALTKVDGVDGNTQWSTIDKAFVGLGNVDNTTDLNKPISTATQTALDALQLGVNSKEPTIAAGTSSQYYRGDKTWQTLDKSAVGLSNVDNTSDANKPISTATQTALNAKADSSTVTSHTGASTGVHGVTGAVVGTTDTQSVSNKTITESDIDGGTASNTSRITLPKAEKTTLDGLTRKQGTLLYDTTTNKPYYDDGTFLKVIGSGSGGSINFISGGDAESGTTGITPYNEGSSASRPSAGIGIAPTGITIGTDSTNPLSGTNSFILSKSAVNARGQGYSWSFTIDRAYQAKVLKIEMDYVVSSGSFVAGSPTTDSDLIVYIIDVDSGKAIEPSSFKLLSKSTTISDRFSATFQTSATSLNYRLCLHVANNTTNTWQIKFDNLAVSPSNYVYGTPITDDAATTFTLSNAGNATVSGTISKLGNKGLFSGTITIGSSLPTGNITLNLPAGHTMTISTGYVNSQISALRGTTTYSASAACASATSVIFGGPNSAVWNATVPATWVAGDTIKFDILVPILGWSSSVQMSDGYDGRVVAASYANSGASTTSISTTYTKITTITSKILDTVESFDSVNNRFRIFTSGNYKISHSIRLEGLAASRVVTTALYKNGSILAEIAESKNTDASVTYNGTMSGDIVVPLIAGDYIEIYGRVDSGTTLVGAYGLSRINIEKLAGNPVISATETVACNVSLAATTSIGTSATQITGFGTPTDTTHGAFSNNEFTAPISGRYFIDADIMFFINTVSVADIIDLHIRKNGTVVKYGRSPKIANQNYQNIKTSLELRLNAGDKITFSASRGTGLTAVDSHPDTQASQISIFKIGN